MTNALADEFPRSETAQIAHAEESAVARVALELAVLFEAVGLSQRDVAARLKVSEAAISQILSADANPTVKRLARIAHALGAELRVHFQTASSQAVGAPVEAVVQCANLMANSALIDPDGYTRDIEWFTQATWSRDNGADEPANDICEAA